MAELGIRAVLILRNRVARIAPSIVIVDRIGQRAVVVSVAMRRRAPRQPQADVAFGLRIAEAKACDREHQIGQAQDCGDLVDLVADDADRADAEPRGLRTEDHGLHRQGRVDAGVEETFKRAVANRLAAQLADALQPPRIAEEDERTPATAPIHGMLGKKVPIAVRFAGSTTRRIEAC